MARLSSLLAEWSELAAGSGGASDAGAYADALLRAGAALDDEALRGLPGSPEDAAVGVRQLADRVEGVYLPWEWLESFCNAVHLPVAELENGWDISDGEDVYFCPRELLADDVDAPEDRRAFVRVDQIRTWPRS